jgi:hypothetical protein
VRDASASANPIAPGSAIAVNDSSVLPPTLAANVGAPADGYRLVYTLDVPARGTFNGTPNFYTLNQSLATNTFDRVAYYLELLKADGTLQYVWASMDAFTPLLTRIGVPTAASKAFFQQGASNLEVKANVSSVTNGAGMAGNLEFWPINYSATNVAGVAGASNSAYDFGDRADAGNYGSMQVHNATYGHTLFALNNWGGDNNPLDLGIGNQPSGNPDWTFANNAGTYARRTLHVLVRPAAGSINGLPGEVAANVPGAAGYQLLYTVNLPVNASFNTNSAAYYSANAYTNVPSFSRVAYYLELQSGSSPTQWIWAAMDAFTSDARKLVVPTNNCFFQQKVTALDVLSNVGGIVSGTNLDTGNVELWPSSYNASNALNIPNASAANLDFGDGGASGSGGGYGSMQVHNHGATATQTLFAVNNFNNNASLCVGIGNRPGQANTDWTHAYNAGSYNHRRLHVLVRPGGDPSPDTTKPTLVRATASRSLTWVTASFSETLADSAATASFFTLNSGALVSEAKLLSSKKDVLLLTTPLSAGQTYTLTVTGVRDRSLNGNLVQAGSSATFTVPTSARPPVLTNVAETANYELIHHLAVTNTSTYASGATYLVDESLYQTCSFDRIAYCLELVTNGVPKWVYVSMDAFTSDLYRIGLPTADRNAVYQQYVSNLNVYASDNVANSSVTTGVGIAAGNIEFWASNYSAGNAKSIPRASASLYDFGDDRGANTGAGHGTMQIHNFAASNTIFAINHFGANGNVPGLGIGNNALLTNGDLDWTFTYNAPQYSTKNLYVLARWGSTPPSQGAGPTILIHPQTRRVHKGETATFGVLAIGATAYQWRLNGAAIPGATQSWLEIPSTSFADMGTYDVLVYSSSTAYATSRSAQLVLPSFTLEVL